MIKMRQFRSYSDWDIVDFIRYHGGYIPVHAKLRANKKKKKGVTMSAEVAEVFFMLIDLEGLYRTPHNIYEVMCA